MVSTVPIASPESSTQQSAPDADATPLTPVEREFMNQDASAVTQNLMELLFPEEIADGFVANSPFKDGTYTMDFSAHDGAINIHNLSISFNELVMKFPLAYNAIIRLKTSLANWATKFKQEARVETSTHVSILASFLK